MSVLAAGAFVAMNPQSAQAARIANGSRIDFIGNADAANTSIDFQEFLDALASGSFGSPTGDWVFVTTATGGFESSLNPGTTGSLPQAVGTIKDIDPVPFAGSLPAWLTFSTNNIAFELTSAVLGSDRQYFLEGVVTGNGFDPTPFSGELTTQISGAGVKTFSGIITAVPTPALLPGLSVMAVNVLRKRKKLKTASA
ncbi:PTPA-CTERM sorting domain-containing protein [filamentous cyanobacterium LEGE 11480]|uniref:PTPA-CTERM sorting domain-containing protein n=1 Tax=Romeriopsis navalis LEGE 11480 TaxID=2777977 RepID=A0A928Z3Q3_9CYAN|nr:PTPA-CTERM sorting domain-containing protein [Romeriopsis navalis]MBE9029525.1 PTPA-CTERM sorting domain-containing protein [Romeriopsis navalis LEGE 11480]